MALPIPVKMAWLRVIKSSPEILKSEAVLILPGYIILNGGIRYTYKKFNVAMNLNNITNKAYWIGAYNNVNKWPGAPRNFMMTAGYNF